VSSSVRLHHYLLRRLTGALPLIFGATLIAFFLTVYFGPDQSYALSGRGTTPAELDQLRSQLGYDRPFVARYASYLKGLVTLDLGYSQTTGESVRSLLARTIPVSAALLLPGFLLGIALALALGMAAAWRQGRWLDRLIGALSAAGMSLSLVVVVIACQGIFGVWLGWFPVRGWSVDGLTDYARHIAIPSLALLIVSLGYNVRFFRALFVEALANAPVVTARAYGLPVRRILIGYVLPASLPPILTRVVFSVPMILLSGSLIIEGHFGIPGVGKVVFEAILAGDQPVLMAMVGLAAVLLVLAMAIADWLARAVDPRTRMA